MPDSPIIIAGEEQSRINPTLADFGLPPAIGVRSVQIFRASRDVPAMCDGKGWTYHHHVDMACWKGKLYVGWNSCEKDEDVWPSRELFSTSDDGATWTSPQELFPQGVSTCLRMYFFCAPNGKMLAIAGLRTDVADTDEDKKGGPVVREIKPDHSFGDIFILQPESSAKPGVPFYTTSSDVKFIEACRQLLADKTYLEQQDRGRLLGDRRMKWHDAAAWHRDQVPGDDEKWVAGKAYSFYRRGNQLVGISKMGWTTTSDDDGETWAQPIVPPTLVTGKAKVWAQQTSDGKYALVYNPSTRTRFPLIVVTSDDGVSFSNMRIVQGELPIQRYEGKFRSIGPQYVRGISMWADDHSRDADKAMWLVYSMSKEDIWVSRVPLSVKADATTTSEPWNIYQPKWSSVIEKDGVLSLSSRDPYDYASATRVIPDTRKFKFSMQLRIPSATQPIELDVLSKFGSLRLLQLQFTPDGEIVCHDQTARTSLGRTKPGEWFTLFGELNLDAHSAALAINGAGPTRCKIAATDTPVNRLALRTGPWRNIGGSRPAQQGTDHSIDPTGAQVRDLHIDLKP